MDEFESWKGGFNEEVGEKVYSIGAANWCWSVIEENDITHLDMKVIDRRKK